jgi:hypothetical protein
MTQFTFIRARPNKRWTALLPEGTSMKVVIPEGFHAKACCAHHHLVHGYKTCVDKAMKIGLMLC